MRYNPRGERNPPGPQRDKQGNQGPPQDFWRWSSGNGGLSGPFGVTLRHQEDLVTWPWLTLQLFFIPTSFPTLWPIIPGHFQLPTPAGLQVHVLP